MAITSVGAPVRLLPRRRNSAGMPRHRAWRRYRQGGHATAFRRQTAGTGAAARTSSPQTGQCRRSFPPRPVPPTAAVSNGYVTLPSRRGSGKSRKCSRETTVSTNSPHSAATPTIAVPREPNSEDHHRLSTLPVCHILPSSDCLGAAQAESLERQAVCRMMFSR